MPDSSKYNKDELNDCFNSKYFASVYKDKILWCRELGGWMLFNGRYWERDSNDRIGQYAFEISTIMQADFKENDCDTGAFKTWVKQLGNNRMWKAMLEGAKVYMGISPSRFDRNELMVNCFNGMYDLKTDSFTGEHIPSFLISKSAHVKYEIFATAPRWIQFLEEIFLGDHEVIAFVQRVIGYSMTASTREHCMFILYGHGRNGKSKFVETIASILGDYAKNCPSSTFIQKHHSSIPNDVARLNGARFVMASETNQNVNIDEELIKQLTGNKFITARFLNKEFFDFEPTFKLFLLTNHKPNIRGTDDGIWRKIMMIPFKFTVAPEVDDKFLGEKLALESSGIFNWMIEGYKQYVKIGLAVPNSIKSATQLYREEEDDIGQFIKQECIIGKDGFITVADFKEKFKSVMGYYKSNKIIHEYMHRNGHIIGDNRIAVGGKQVRGYIKIRWATEMDRITGEPVGWDDN